MFENSQSHFILNSNSSESSPPTQFAFVSYKDQQFCACYKPTLQEPHSAATQLIQGIYFNYPEIAYTILRNRIYLNYNPKLMCRAMIQVAAKRYTVDLKLNPLLEVKETNNTSVAINFKPQQDLSTLNNQELTIQLGLQNKNHTQSCNSSQFSIDSEYSQSKQQLYLDWLKVPIENSANPLYVQSRKVKSFLVIPKKNIHIYSINNNVQNKSLHAEVLLLQNYFSIYKSGFHESTELYTSLQCCKMCAAMYWHMHSDPLKNARAYYLQAEDGRSSLNSILRAGSNSRRELFNNYENIAKQIEYKIET